MSEDSNEDSIYSSLSILSSQDTNLNYIKINLDKIKT